LIQKLEISKLLDICLEHGAVRIALFGSFARGDADATSDIDLLVSFSSPRGLFEIVQMERELSESMERKVDLLTEGALSPYLRDRILSEELVIYEKVG
jgi:hypothetical protein